MLKNFKLIICCLLLASATQAQTLLQENFDTGIPGTWTITDGGAATGDSWTSSASRQVDGTAAALVDSDADGNGIQLIETLTSPAFDATGATYVYLTYDHWYNNIGADSAMVEVFDGTAWQTVIIYHADIGGAGAPDQPVFDITAYANANMQVRFHYDDADDWAWYWSVDNVHVYGVNCAPLTGQGTANVLATSADLVWTDPNSAGNYVVEWGPAGFTQGTGTSVATTASPFALTGLTSNTAYDYYVQAVCTVSDSSAWSGPFSFTTTVSCPAPTVLTAANITMTSADLGWTENGSATEWEIEWGANGFAQGAGTLVSTTSNPHNLTGLMQSSSYDFYVRAVCGAGDSSTWVGPFNFTTVCGVNVAPYLNGAEANAIGYPAGTCWSNYENGAYRWQVNSGGTGSGGTGPNAAYAGSNYFYTEASSGATNDTAELISPVVDMTALTSPALSFYYHMFGTQINKMYIDIYSAGAWTNEVDSLVGAVQTANADAWMQKIVALGAFAGSTDLQVRFRAIRGAGFSGDISVDNFEITNIFCFPVTALDTANITSSTVDLSWTDPNGATGWEIEYGPMGFTQGTGMTVMAGSNPFTLTGLAANVAYDYYVRAVCSAGDSSSWAGPLAFTTLVAADDAAFSVFLEPTGGCGDSTMNVVVVVQNQGSAPITSMNVFVDGAGAMLSSSFAGTLNFGDYDTISIGTINTYAGGTFNLTGWVEFTGDTNPANDTAWYSFSTFPVEPVGYDATTCGVDSAWLAAMPGFGYAWYDAMTGGTMVASGDSFMVPSITTQDTYYLEYITGANISLLTTFANNNGASGNMFDITTTTSTTVTGFDIHTTNTTPITVEIYYIANNTYVGNQTTAGVWTLEGTYNVTGAGVGNPTNVVLGTGIPVVAGQSTAVYVYLPGGGIQYTNGGGAVPSVISDGTLTFSGGDGTGALFGSIFSPRLFNGEIYYQGSPCSAVRTAVTATNNSLPMPNLGADTSICGTGVVLDAGAGYASYMWSSGGTMQMDSAMMTGMYYTTVTDANGCMGSDSIMLTFNTNPMPNLGADTAMCGMGAIVLDAGAGYTGYMWSTGGSTQMDSAMMTGMYYATVTDGNGCMGSDSVMVTFNMNPMPMLGPDTIACTGATVVLDAGAGYTAYAWNTGGSSQTESVTMTGTYNATVTDANGCMGWDSIMVTIDTCLSVNTFEMMDAAITVFPNPNNGQFNISIEANDLNNFSFDVMNSSGRRIFFREIGAISGLHTETVQLENLPTGVYFVRVISNKGTATQKVVIQK